MKTKVMRKAATLGTDGWTNQGDKNINTTLMTCTKSFFVDSTVLNHQGHEALKDQVG
jgi:hypothetical protein